MALDNGTTIGMVTAIYFGVGIIFSINPFCVNDKALCRVAIITTIVCCWLLWLLCFMSQMHPMANPEPQPINPSEHSGSSSSSTH
ncbi:hypothetical protein SAMD00019534_017180 [Acytostelium subglobosum LB1]|uniref:hypothetical protein n=1 Tax=Acytostelium subglobosum LB1 TaxID=1410327 RepID=UPI000644F3A9|nr:hypothetical protein SAMD00019534_017180 [Acytostelium subglobosum LB1]GAM18543.1 hypothetical protein SAMD00019534_017180 [Acytostelium subglobosum LB1]|eukprot:XP_012757763.1 hypothetical protein SAMD00019534_017180 [Acytostelium subglobosum LB1]